jgi:hypothetical protein
MTTFMRCMHFLLCCLTVFVWGITVFGFFMLRGILNDKQADGETFIAAYFVATWFALIFYSVGRDWIGGKNVRS